MPSYQAAYDPYCLDAGTCAGLATRRALETIDVPRELALTLKQADDVLCADSLGQYRLAGARRYW